MLLLRTIPHSVSTSIVCLRLIKHFGYRSQIDFRTAIIYIGGAQSKELKIISLIGSSANGINKQQLSISLHCTCLGFLRCLTTAESRMATEYRVKPTVPHLQRECQSNVL